MYRQSDYGSVAALKYGSTAEFHQASGGAGPYRDNPSATHVPMTEFNSYRPHDIQEKNDLYAAPRTRKKRRLALWLVVVLTLLAILAAIAVPVYLFVIKPKMGNDGNDSSNDGSGNSSGNDNGSDNNQEGNNHGSNNGDSNTQERLTTGGDGSIVTKEDGSTFIYNNTFGGYWVHDPANPLNNSARAQAHTPPLTEEWNWGVDRIYG